MWLRLSAVVTGYEGKPFMFVNGFDYQSKAKQLLDFSLKEVNVIQNSMQGSKSQLPQSIQIHPKNHPT